MDPSSKSGLLMEAWLQEHELWDITMGAEHQPSGALIQANSEQVCLVAITKRNWKNKDEQASGTIVLCLEPSVQHMIIGKKIAKAIWDQLQTSFGMQNADQLITDFKSAVVMMLPVDRPLTTIDQMTIKFG